MRKLFALTAIFSLFSFSAFAEPICSTSSYRNVLPSKDFKFGSTKSEVKSYMKKNFGNIIIFQDNDEALTFRPQSQKIFDMIKIEFRSGRAINLVYSYSNSWQSKLGGAANAVKFFFENLQKKAGQHDNYSPESDGGRFDWNSKDGLALRVIGKDPDTILLIFMCRALDAELLKKQQKNVNLGF